MPNDLRQVGINILQTAASLPSDTDGLTRYLFVEEICYAVLDSEYMNYPDGELEKYLLQFLAKLRCDWNVDEAMLR